METPALIMAAMWRNDWETSIDLKDAYFHILVDKRSQKYLHFVIDGMPYKFRALLFRLSTAPSGFHVHHERGSSLCAPESYPAAHLPG